MRRARPVLIFACSLFFAASGAGARGRQGTRAALVSASLGGLSESLESLGKEVSPAIVQVFAKAVGTVDASPSGPDTFVTRRGSGSGVLIASDGWIVTSAHVVDTARSVSVMLAPRPAPGSPNSSILSPRGRRMSASVVGLDQETDIAVLKIEGEGFPFLSLGDSDELRAGQLVMAFGSPLGLANSVSLGVVSATARQLAEEAPMVYIQTDAPINPGNSGGPLVDASGSVVGINTLILSQSGGNEGIGFAVPSNIVEHVVSQVRRHGRVRRGIIGLGGQTITPELAIGLALVRSWGVIVGHVDRDGPAWMAGIEVGDIIHSLDGKVMENARQLDVNLYRKPIGSEVELEILRGNDRAEAKVEVLERPGDPLRFADLVDQKEHLVARLGILGLPLSGELRDWLPVELSDGVLVAARTPDSPFDETEGLLLGDVIRSMNGRPVKDLLDIKVILGQTPVSSHIVMHVERNGLGKYLTLSP